VDRLITILACVALLAGNESLPLLHVHDYSDHDHPTHQHGPAFHSHERALTDHHAPAPASHGAQFAPCEPDAHVLSLAAVAATPPSQHVHVAAAPVALFAFTRVAPPPLEARDEVRAHSPPGLTDSPLRAPPSSHPA
jgi:hypothetical protein